MSIEPSGGAIPIAEALRELRERQKLTQTAAGRIAGGAPDHRTLSHWETGRKHPSLRLLSGYLEALGFDFHDLQDAIDQVDGSAARRVDELAAQVDRLARVCEDLGERRMRVLERRSERVPELAAELERVRPDLGGLGRRVETIGAALIALESRLRELEVK